MLSTPPATSDRRLPGGDAVRGDRRGVEPGAAVAVHGEARHGRAEAGRERRVAGDVVAGGALGQPAADDHVLDLGAVDAGALHGAAQHVRRHRDAVGLIQRTAARPSRCRCGSRRGPRRRACREDSPGSVPAMFERSMSAAPGSILETRFDQMFPTLEPRGDRAPAAVRRARARTRPASGWSRPARSVPGMFVVLARRGRDHAAQRARARGADRHARARARSWAS